MECKEQYHSDFIEGTVRFNRDIVECKDGGGKQAVAIRQI